VTADSAQLFPVAIDVSVLCAVAADTRMAVILVMLNSDGLSGSRAQFSINPISLKNQVNGGSERTLGRCSMPRLDNLRVTKPTSATTLWTPIERRRAGVKGLTSARYLFQNGNPTPGAPFAERRGRLTTLGWPLILARDIPDYEFAVPSVIEKICSTRSAAATFLVAPHSSLPAA
jgi:hypothetical protein